MIAGNDIRAGDVVSMTYEGQVYKTDVYDYRERPIGIALGDGLVALSGAMNNCAISVDDFNRALRGINTNYIEQQKYKPRGKRCHYCGSRTEAGRVTCRGCGGEYR
jgi:hypothetical protein